MIEQLSSAALVAIWSAMGVYTLAFIMFTVDLARRSKSEAVSELAAASRSGAVRESVEGAFAESRRPGLFSTVSGSTATLTRPMAASTPNSTPPVTSVRARGPRFERVAFSLTIVAWVVHVIGAVLRGIAQGHVPWSNMFEFCLTASAIIVGVFIAVQLWQNLRFLGVYITGFALLTLGVGTTNFYVDVKPLPPALQSFWLVIHVFVAVLGTSFFALGAGLSVTQLLQERGSSRLKFLKTLPDALTLENLAYRVIVVGFAFWTFTLIAGAIWAERAWGRYWGWDTKEVWTFIIWTIFAGYIHARATRGWRGSRSAWLALVGFSAVMFNFTIVNLFFKGLHSYSGL